MLGLHLTALLARDERQQILQTAVGGNEEHVGLHVGQHHLECNFAPCDL